MSAQIAEILVYEVRRVGNDEVPSLVGRYVAQVVRAIDRNAI